MAQNGSRNRDIMVSVILGRPMRAAFLFGGGRWFILFDSFFSSIFTLMAIFSPTEGRGTQCFLTRGEGLLLC